MQIRALERDKAALLKDLRLRALAEAPDAFAHTLADAVSRPDAYWHDLVATMTPPAKQRMFVAEHDEQALGLVFAPRPSHLDRPHPPRARRSRRVRRIVAYAVR